LHANDLESRFSQYEKDDDNSMPTGWLHALIVVCCFAGPADARDLTWKHITASHDGLTNFYVDARSVVAHGTVRRARLLFDFSKLQQGPDTLIEHRSMVEVTSIDCGHNALAPINATKYAQNMGQGHTVVTATSSQPLRHVVAASGSIDERVIDFVCKMR
jgi:hypothetical protein